VRRDNLRRQSEEDVAVCGMGLAILTLLRYQGHREEGAVVGKEDRRVGNGKERVGRRRCLYRQRQDPHCRNSWHYRQ
jgi:hypothetical protein